MVIDAGVFSYAYVVRAPSSMLLQSVYEVSPALKLPTKRPRKVAGIG